MVKDGAEKHCVLWECHALYGHNIRLCCKVLNAGFSVRAYRLWKVEQWSPNLAQHLCENTCQGKKKRCSGRLSRSVFSSRRWLQTSSYYTQHLWPLHQYVLYGFMRYTHSVSEARRSYFVFIVLLRLSWLGVHYCHACLITHHLQYT